MNVLTLSDAGTKARDAVAFPGRVLTIQEQCARDGVAVAFVQEARSAQQQREGTYYAAWTSGAKAGHGGCEIWLRTGSSAVAD
eukprot:8972894-Alexandrium_andersonii.AAC.1